MAHHGGTEKVSETANHKVLGAFLFLCAPSCPLWLAFCLFISLCLRASVVNLLVPSKDGSHGQGQSSLLIRCSRQLAGIKGAVTLT
jgi:hypothetical protein